MPSIQDRLTINNSEFYSSLKPVESRSLSGLPGQVPVAPSSSATKATEGYSLSPWGNPSPNRSLLPNQFMYDFDTYRMYPSFFTFRRKWVNKT